MDLVRLRLHTALARSALKIDLGLDAVRHRLHKGAQLYRRRPGLPDRPSEAS